MKDGVGVGGRRERWMLKVAKDEIREVRVCSGKGGEKFLEITAKL